MKILIIIISITILKVQISSCQKADANEAINAFNLLEKGHRKIVLGELRNATLLLGNGESGKTIFIKWVLGDDKLIAEETEDGSFTIIEDGIGRSTNQPHHTLYPELLIDRSTDTAYYDMPEFNTNELSRSSHEIATTYFIKRVVDHASSIKLLLVINYSSFQNRRSRDFIDLLFRATQLIKNIDKFKHSIALIVTQVDNNNYENDNSTLNSIKLAINGIAHSLVEVKHNLANDSSKVELVKLLDIFLTKTRDDNSYPKIGIFPRAQRAGALSANSALQQRGKDKVIQMLTNLPLSSKNAADFSYALSLRAQNDISYLMEMIGNVVEQNLNEIMGELIRQFNRVTLNATRAIDELLLRTDEDDIETKVREKMERTNSFLASGLEIVSQLCKDLNLMVKSPTKLVGIIRAAISPLSLRIDLSALNDTLTTISNQGEYYDFLQLVSGKSGPSIIVSNAWALKWENITEKITNLRTNFICFTNGFVERVAGKVKTFFSSAGQKVYEQHKALVERLKAEINPSVSKDDGDNNNNYTRGSLITKTDLNETVNEMNRFIENIRSAKNFTLLLNAKMNHIFLGKLSNRPELLRKLKIWLYYLSDKYDEKMRNSWAEELNLRAGKMAELNREFETFVHSWIKELLNVYIQDAIEISMRYVRQNYYIVALKTINEMRGLAKDEARQKSINNLKNFPILISKLSRESINLTHPIDIFQRMTLFTSNFECDRLKELMVDIKHYLTSLTLLLRVNNEVFMVPVAWRNAFESAGNKITELWDRVNHETSASTSNYVTDSTNYLLTADVAIGNDRVIQEMRSECNAKDKNHTSDVVEKIESKVEKLMKEFSQSLVKHYCAKLNAVRAEIENLALKSARGEVINVSKAEEMAFELNSGLTITSDIITRVRNLRTPLGLMSIINDSISNLSEFDDIRQNLIENLSFQVELLNLSLAESKVQFEAPERWSLPIKNERRSFEKSLNDFKSNFLTKLFKHESSLIAIFLSALARTTIDCYENKLSTEVWNNGAIALDLKRVENVISELIRKNEKEDELLSKLNNVFICLTELDICGNKKMLGNALNVYKFLEYLQAFSERQLGSEKSFYNNNNNFHLIEDARKWLNESHVWYTFLIELDENLSQYEIQSDVSRYNVANVDDWGNANKPQGISINKDNIRHFLDKLNFISDDIKNVEMTESRLRALQNLLAINLRSKYEEIKDESGQKIILQGRFIKFSHFVDANGTFLDPSKFNVRSICIFASNTVFIDRPLSAVGKRVNISIIAPKWEVVDRQTIILDGEDGKDIFLQAAPSGKFFGEKGADGKTGEAGGAAGNFFGIGSVFVNGRALNISANGGRGGRGQNGGDGHVGKDGQFVKYEQINDSKFKSWVNTIFTWVQDVFYRAKSFNYSVAISNYDACFTSYGCYCTFSGQRGRNGSDGGNGGAGGAMGKEGKVGMVELGTGKSGISIHRFERISERGSRGYGGKGGRSVDLVVWYREHRFPYKQSRTRLVVFHNSGTITAFAQNGKDGV